MSARYYIRDTRSVVGNCALWWCPEGKGYTTQLEEAGVYGEGEAKRIQANRGTDVAVPVEVAKRASVTHVRVERLGREMDAWKAGNAEPPPTQPGPTEHADMALRFRYEGGVFVVGSEHASFVSYAPHLPRPEHFRVSGLRVRIVYEHTREGREAALVCAESWQGRMMQAGAREVVVVGEEVGK